MWVSERMQNRVLTVCCSTVLILQQCEENDVLDLNSNVESFSFMMIRNNLDKTNRVCTRLFIRWIDHACIRVDCVLSSEARRDSQNEDMQVSLMLLTHFARSVDIHRKTVLLNSSLSLSAGVLSCRKFEWNF